MAQMRSPPSNYVIHTSPMQAELSNPDSRPLPLGWADHFDPRYVVSKFGRHTTVVLSLLCYRSRRW